MNEPLELTGQEYRAFLLALTAMANRLAEAMACFETAIDMLPSVGSLQVDSAINRILGGKENPEVDGDGA